ncbi:MAG: sugar transferase [Ilyomonas sp.]
MIAAMPNVYSDTLREPYWPGKETTCKKIIFIGENTFYLEEELKIAGSEVILCNNIYEANKYLFNNINFFLPDTICCDINLPLKNLQHLSGALAANNRLRTIPLLLVSRNDIFDNYFSGIDYVDDVISADLPVTEFLDKIDILKKFKSLKQTLPYSIIEEKKQKFSIQPFLRRAMDIVLASVFLLLLSPILLLICILIKLESKGPVFYVSFRAGKGYKVFKFYKFRTMIPDADKKVDELRNLNQYDPSEENSAMFFKIKSDPRITTIGKFLRNTSLDELPQLINVLIGDMSIVGNRPLPLAEACTLTTDEAARRFLAPAGITGLWQIEKRGKPEMSVQERIDLDIDYAHNHSFLYDLRILLITPKGIIQKSDV